MKGYDFEVLDDELNKNKEDAIKRDQVVNQLNVIKHKKYKLRKWVKVCLWTLFVAFISISIYQMFTIKTIHTTPVGTYQCNGGLIKVCGGSKEVADYLGV